MNVIATRQNIAEMQEEIICAAIADATGMSTFADADIKRNIAIIAADFMKDTIKQPNQ
jgi:hypothetical protein